MTETEIVDYVHTKLSRYGHMADNETFGSKEWKVTFVNTWQLGYCCFTKHIININLAHKRHIDIDELFDTINHEIAHALAGIQRTDSGRRMYHGKEWKRWAIILGAKPKAIG